MPEGLSPTVILRIPYWLLKTLLIASVVVAVGTGVAARHYHQVEQEAMQLQVWKTVTQEQTSELAHLNQKLQALETQLAELELQADGLMEQLSPSHRPSSSLQATARPPGPVPILQINPLAGVGGPPVDLPQQATQLAQVATRLEKQYQNLSILLQDAQEEARRFPDQWPVAGVITSSFGTRRDPLSRRLQFHAGLDLAAPYGSAVTSAAAGVVTFAGYRPGYGYTVVVRHTASRETLYAHLSRVLVKPGQEVDKGHLIGRVGSSGHSTGPHLHFEVHESGTPVDPYPYLTGQRYAFLAGNR
ncbi:MAG: M23 family metallopeptidase [Bacillota bacterium]|nr:M23 family metallopeptidase [Bacillota bacterium]